MMKKSKISLWKWALGICMLFAGVQSAWAQNQNCAGMAYIKPPASWTSVFVSGQNGKIVEAKFNTISGYFYIDLADINAADAGFSAGDKERGIRDQQNNVNHDSLHYLTPTGIKTDLDDATKLKNEHPFKCPGEGERTFVAVDAAGKVTQTSTPPGAKYFMVMIPPTDDFEEWMSSVPMLSLDGGKNGKPMQAVDGMCGWYSYEFFGEAPTDDVVLYRDDDDLREDLLGANGNWETDRANPKTIALSLFFDTLCLTKNRRPMKMVSISQRTKSWILKELALIRWPLLFTILMLACIRHSLVMVVKAVLKAARLVLWVFPSSKPLMLLRLVLE